MNNFLLFLILVVIIVIVCMYLQNYKTEKLKEKLTIKMAKKNNLFNDFNDFFPQGHGSMNYLEEKHHGSSLISKPVFNGNSSSTFLTSHSHDSVASHPNHSVASHSHDSVASHPNHSVVNDESKILQVLNNIFSWLKSQNIKNMTQTTPAHSTDDVDKIIGTWTYKDSDGNSYVSKITKSGSNYLVTPVTAEKWWSRATIKHNSGNTYITNFHSSNNTNTSSKGGMNTALSADGNKLSFSNNMIWTRTSKPYIPIGAYRDVVAERAMNKTISLDQTYSADSCSTACKDYSYFGLQYPSSEGSEGSQCFCSNSLSETTKYGPFTPASACGQKGGNDCNYVYENISATPAHSTPAHVK